MLFIGGTGGSGTRLISLFCSKAGYYIGDHINESLDAMHVEPFYRRHTREYLEGTADDMNMREDLIKCLENHIGSDTNPLCSVKNPRSLLLLPFIHSMCPDMKFVHVVRSGLSMSFSGNRRHTLRYGDLFVDDSDIDGSCWSPELAMKVWAETNLNAYEYGSTYLGNNYMWIKYEELCSKKMDAYERLTDFIGCSRDIIPAMTRKAEIPETWKRGRKKPKEQVLGLEKIGEKAIRHFGYGFYQLEK